MSRAQNAALPMNRGQGRDVSVDEFALRVLSARIE